MPRLCPSLDLAHLSYTKTARTPRKIAAIASRCVPCSQGRDAHQNPHRPSPLYLATWTGPAIFLASVWESSSMASCCTKSCSGTTCESGGIGAAADDWRFRHSPPLDHHGPLSEAPAACTVDRFRRPSHSPASVQGSEVLVLFSPRTTAATAFRRLADWMPAFFRQTVAASSGLSRCQMPSAH